MLTRPLALSKAKYIFKNSLQIKIALAYQNQLQITKIMQIETFHVKTSEYVVKYQHVQCCCCQYFTDITHEYETEN